MKTILSRTLQQPKQRRPLIATGSTPDDYDGAAMRFYCGKFEKVVLIAGQHFVAELLQQIAQVIGDVMVEQKLRDAGADIWLAASKSISPRWSS